MLRLVVCVLLLAGLASAMIEKRGNVNSTLTGRPPSCPRIVQLARGVNSVRRDQTIVCAFRVLDLNGDGKLNTTEYSIFGRDHLNTAERGVAPSWEEIREWCDCNSDTQITADEIRHATGTCLESNFWIDRVYDKVCPLVH